MRVYSFIVIQKQHNRLLSRYFLSEFICPGWMLSQIQERDAALQAVNDDLEDRVARRTRDLEQLNALLREEVAERKRAQEALIERDEQLRQSQKLEAVGRLAGGVAHDFNNQLAIIRGYVDMVLDEMDEDSREYQHLGQIGKAVERSASLTEQLLMFSSKQPVNMKPLDVNHHVGDLQKMLDRILGENIEVDLDLEDEIWTVSADSGNIDHVITNLSLNARDAMPEGGRLTVQTRNAKIDDAYCLLVPDARPGNFACLTVSDTGTGMSDEVLSRLFEPFFTTKEAGKGTGLGLSVVYGIVQSHGGWVTVESETQKGSRLSIFLPAVEDEALRKEEEPVISLDQFRGSGQQVLLIEDEPALRAMTAQALTDKGYRVRACGSAGEATHAFGQTAFDLVLSDVGLPDGRGTDVVFGFLDEQPDLHAILVTGYTDERSEWQRVQDAGLLILQKPVAMSDLLKCVHEALHTGGA